jgi:hypothetical protein
MRKLFAIVGYFCGVALVSAADWQPSPRLLDAVCQIESSGGLYVLGDRGLSLGHFQFQKAAWADVCVWRQKRNLPVYDYRANVFDPRISRIYAGNYLTILHDRLKEQYDREPTPAEIYAAYNMGLNAFRKCNYRLAQVNKVTLEKCRLVVALVAVE